MSAKALAMTVAMAGLAGLGVRADGFQLSGSDSAELIVLDDGDVALRFTESGTVVTVDGDTLALNMEIDISDVNEVFEVPYPVDSIYKAGEKPADDQ